MQIGWKILLRMSILFYFTAVAKKKGNQLKTLILDWHHRSRPHVRAQEPHREVGELGHFDDADLL